jgi:hypothetical protein
MDFNAPRANVDELSNPFDTGCLVEVAGCNGFPDNIIVRTTGDDAHPLELHYIFQLGTDFSGFTKEFRV